MSDSQHHAAADPMWIYQLLKFVGWVLLALVVVFLLIAPVAFAWLLQSTDYSRQVVRWMEPIEFVQSVLIHILTMGWMFFLGGCLASFLNVVAWRVPRGKPITGSSHCSVCQNRLKFLDNMPITGWLRNSGRCSQCGNPIAVRYLLAELILGTIFLLLGSVVFLTGAANWPIEKVLQPAGFEHLLFSLKWDVVVVLLWHLALVCFLFTFMLIESDDMEVPASIVATGIGFVCFVAVLRPDVWLVFWRQPIFLWQSGQMAMLDRVLNLLFGCGVGFVVGHVTRWATGSSSGHPSGVVAGMSLVGMFLGWQAALAVGAVTLVGWLCCRLLLSRSLLGSTVTPSACVLVATVIQLLLWGNFYSLREISFL